LLSVRLPGYFHYVFGDRKSTTAGHHKFFKHKIF
jgi:hypothetical protein